MNLYLVVQNDNNDYDTFDSFVVAAVSVDQAVKYRDGGDGMIYDFDKVSSYTDWALKKENVTAELVCTANEGTKCGTIIINSFNAG